MGHPFTVGVEEEFQIVDPATWELRSHVSELLASSAATFDRREATLRREETLRTFCRALFFVMRMSPDSEHASCRS